MELIIIMKKILLISCLLIAYLTGYTQVSPVIQLSDSARIFGEGVISQGHSESNASFTLDSKTVYFSKGSLNAAYRAIFYSTLKDAQWTKPEAVSFTGVYRDTDPLVSPDGKRLYFLSDRPVNGKPFTDRDYHFFYVELNGNKVASEPKQFNLPLTDGLKPLYLSFADNGNVYFLGLDNNNEAHIYKCEFKNGNYLPPVSMSFSDKKYNDLDPVVADDESFMIFASTNRKGYGSSDLWVSFNNNGAWAEPVNMGNKINTKGSDGAPGLSRDHKTLYFSSYREKPERPVYKDGKATTKEVLDLLYATKNGASNIYEINISDLKEP
jgi:Tol biopolymer transport system component